MKNGLKTTEATAAKPRVAQVITDADMRRILSCALEIDREGEWDGDLYRLVLVLAATGARFSQVIRLSVADVKVSSSA